jgi:hypothetical protein
VTPELEAQYRAALRVALDGDGDLAAGTSTGGLTNKPVGRVGDSPIIGAGAQRRQRHRRGVGHRQSPRWGATAA